MVTGPGFFDLPGSPRRAASHRALYRAEVSRTVCGYAFSSTATTSTEVAGKPSRTDGSISANSQPGFVEQAGGDRLWSARYYTGVEIGERAFNEGQSRLDGFLSAIDQLPGFFVKRFPRRVRSAGCPSCGETFRHSQEKEVDSAIVADMVSLAAVDACDGLVLVSGDADLAPALDTVRRLGKLCFVATWGGEGLSARLRSAAYDHIDLLGGLDAFSTEEQVEIEADATGERKQESALPAEGDATPTEALHDALLVELERAEQHFHGGYVGANYFTMRWVAEGDDVPFDGRREALDLLIESGQVELYEADDGVRALRVRRDR